MTNSSTKQNDNDAVVAVLGGGPAGVFTAIDLLHKAAAQNRRLRVVLFEHRRSEPSTEGGYPSYAGCPQCAGGLSPTFRDALKKLGIKVPKEVIQSCIRSLSIQGKWKGLILPVPEDRPLSSVYIGNLPFSHHEAFARCVKSGPD